MAAGISPAYWNRIETGRQAGADYDTVTAMCHAVNVASAALAAIGEGALARDTERLREMADPEDYLRRTPGATDDEVRLLLTFWRALRDVSAENRRRADDNAAYEPGESPQAI